MRTLQVGPVDGRDDALAHAQAGAPLEGLGELAHQVTTVSRAVAVMAPAESRGMDTTSSM